MPETRYADSDGVRIAYEVRREQAPDGADWLVLVHGLGYARWGWGPLLDHLVRDLRLVLVDNRGIGDSDVPDGPYTAREMAGDVVAVLDAVGLDRPHLLGTSLGGMIAQEVAAGWPDRVDRLILVASTPGGDHAHDMPEVTQRLIAEMPAMEPEQALRRAVANALSPATVEDGAEIVEEIVRRRLADPQDRDGWQAQAAAGTAYDAGGRLADITAPTLILHGEEDVVVDPRNASVLADLVDGAEVRMLPDVGHLLFWEQPAEVAAHVHAFLGGRARGA